MGVKEKITVERGVGVGGKRKICQCKSFGYFKITSPSLFTPTRPGIRITLDFS